MIFNHGVNVPWRKGAATSSRHYERRWGIAVAAHPEPGKKMMELTNRNISLFYYIYINYLTSSLNKKDNIWKIQEVVNYDI